MTNQEIYLARAAEARADADQVARALVQADRDVAAARSALAKAERRYRQARDRRTQAVREALRGDESMRARLITGLRQSAARGEAVARLEARLAEVGLFTSSWREAQGRALSS